MNTGPEFDEIEVTIFGRDSGECVVVHIGDGKWIIIDSTFAWGTVEPVAKAYLSSIDVSPDQVLAIVCTHWHDDHCAGLAELALWAEQALVFLSPASQKQNLEHLLNYDKHAPADANTRVSEYSRLRAILKIREKKSTPSHYGSPGIDLFDFVERINELDSAKCLSPSASDVNACAASLGPFVDKIRKGEAITVPSPNENFASIAIAMKFSNSSGDSATEILLGSDLDGPPTIAARGWNAVLDLPFMADRVFSYAKVPHHGSTKGYCEKAWSTLTCTASLATLTPFSGSGLPKRMMIEKYLGHHTELIITDNSRILNEIDIVNETSALTGVTEPIHGVQARSKRGSSTWAVELFGNAALLK